jgi:hypothetical protein
MKKLLLLAAVGLGLSGIACTSANNVQIKVFNPDQNLSISYLISASSDLDKIDKKSEYAPQNYELEVNPDGDNVSIWVEKTSLTDTNELRVELYYKGKVERIGSSSSVAPIILTYEIK